MEERGKAPAGGLGWRRIVPALDKEAWRALALLVGLLLAAFALLRWLAPGADTLSRWTEAYLPAGVWGWAAYVAASSLLMSLAVPRQAVSFVGGCAFGALPGALLSTLGATLGCMIVFGASRCLGRSFVERRYGGRARKLNAVLVRHPFLLAFALRLFPSGNNWLSSLLAGVSRIPSLPFFLGSCLGYLPQNIIFSLLGSGMRIDMPWRTGLGLVLLGLSCVLAAWLYKRYGAFLRPCQGRDA